MNELDLRLKLLSGHSIEVDGVGGIKPLTVRDIVGHGYTKYLAKLNLLVLEIEDLVEEGIDIKKLNKNVFDLLVGHGGETVIQELEDTFKFFLGQDVKVIKKSKIISVGNQGIIGSHNFNKVREVLKWQNCINSFGESEENNKKDNATDKAKEILMKLKKAKETTKKYKNRDEGDSDIDIADIISAVASKSNSLNKLNVFDLTLFQLYDEFRRLELIDQYDVGIKSMLAGAKDVKLKHWSSRTLG